MLEQFKELPPIWQALIGTCFTWGVTALGASLVFAFKEVNRKVMDGALGFAAGIMIAASYWSLLAPAIEMSEGLSVPIWFPAAAGFLGGGIFLRICDRLIPHLHLFLPISQAEGIPTKWRKSILLVLAITLHNIPEGLAIGVAFGSAALNTNGYTVSAAIALTIGIGLQNFPEGMAVSMPLRREGISRWRCFNYGQLSGMVEPLAGVAGAAAVIYAAPILPYALAFAAGAMIFVVVEEAIPESQQAGNADIATLGAMVGFTVMMILDVALG